MYVSPQRVKIVRRRRSAQNCKSVTFRRVSAVDDVVSASGKNQAEATGTRKSGGWRLTGRGLADDGVTTRPHQGCPSQCLRVEARVGLVGRRHSDRRELSQTLPMVVRR